MATQAPTTTPDMSQAMQSAGQELASKIAALNAPAPAAGSTPAPPVPATPAAPPAPAAVAAPVQPEAAPAPSTPPAATPPVDLASITDPNARFFLETLNGGDLQKALAKATEYNNRLGALYKAHPELFAPGAVADPKAPPPAAPEPALFQEPTQVQAPTATQPIPPAGTAARPSTPAPVPEVAPELPPPVELDWAQIHQQADEQVRADATCTTLVREWTLNAQAVAEDNQRINTLKGEINYLRMQVADPRLGLSDIDKADRNAEIREKQTEFNLARQDKMIREAEMREQDARFQATRKSYIDRIANQQHEAATQQAQSAETETIVQQSFQEMSQAWEPALARAAQFQSIPPDLFEDFKAEAKREAMAQFASDDSFVIRDLDAFLGPVAQRFNRIMDKYHRAQSTVYAQQAIQRAAAPSPVLAPGTPVAPTVPLANLSPEAVMEQASRDLRARMRSR